MAVMDVDDAVVRQQPDAEKNGGEQRGSAKLRRAAAVARKTEEELSALCQGLNQRIMDLGIEVSRANQYRGVEEKTLSAFAAFGSKWAKRRANILRHERLKSMRTKDAVKEIADMVLATINELGESEDAYEVDQREYETTLNEVLGKQKDATPLYLEARARREKLDGEVLALGKLLEETDLAARPLAERKYEERKRELDVARLDEATYFAVVKNAQEAIPTLQKNRDAATRSIQALHGMRQAILERFADFKVVLERAPTSMRARASMELYQDVDPAFSAAVTLISETNVATAGAALEVWLDRIGKACVSPEKSKALLMELLEHVHDAEVRLRVMQQAVAGGSREPLQIEDQRRLGLVPIDLTPDEAVAVAAAGEQVHKRKPMAIDAMLEREHKR